MTTEPLSLVVSRNDVQVNTGAVEDFAGPFAEGMTAPAIQFVGPADQLVEMLRAAYESARRAVAEREP